jgi:hypothetical protein
MPPRAESSYYSFDTKKMNLDQIIAGTATCITMSCILAYFIYLGINYT